MIFDIRTLMVCNAALTAIIGGAFLLYRVNRKTYPGFGIWLSANFLITLGYLFGGLRGHMPKAAAIVLCILPFMAAAVLRLDGILRFTGRGVSPGAITSPPF